MNGTKQNPYVGTRPFKTDEGELFFGRERESLDLLSLVISERLVLFYAQSGAGKSSLINAKLIPGLLAEEEYQVLPVGRVGGGEPFAGEVFDNIYIYNLINGLLQQNVRQDVLSKLTLTRFLNGLGTGKESGLKRILIIDQFEELFSTYQEAWKKREDFFRQLAQAVHDIPELWVLLVMREDYIAHLDPYLYLLPGKLRVRYYMQRLQRDAALEAIKRPVENLRPYAKGVAEKLVDDLCSVKVYKPDGTLEMRPGQYVEPVQLQVVCSNLWKNLPWNGTQITEKDLQEVGDTDTSLGNHYAGRVKEVAEAKNVKERKIREWFTTKLISPNGVRNMVLREPGGKSSGLENNVIQALHDLVRAEQRGGAIFYELTHDRLVEPIIENNKRWGTEHYSPLQRQVALWKDHGQNESWLLRGKAWTEAEEWAHEHQEELTDTEWEFLEASRSLVERERRAKWLTRLIAAMGIVAILLAVFAYRANLDAQRQARIATARQLAAQSQSILATGNSKQMTAVLLAIQSMRMFPSIDAVRVLQNNLLARGISRMSHDNYVRAVAFSPDGKYVASGSADRTARVWDAATGQEVARTTYDGIVTSIAFSPDGRHVLSGSSDNTARVWEAITGKEIARVNHDASVSAVAFSPDGNYVVSASLDKTVWVWEAITGLDIAHMTHDGEVSSIAFSPDGKYVVSGSLDGTARIWEIASGKEVVRMTHEDGIVNSVAFGPDGKYVATGSEINAYVWDAVTGEQKFSIAYGERVTSVAFSPDGKYVASGSWSHLVQVWEVATGLKTASMIHDSNVRVVAFSPDGKYVASGGRDNTARVWDAVTGQEVARTTYDGIVTSLAFSPDSKYVVSGSLDNVVRVWEATASKELARIPHDERVWSVAFSPDGKYIVSGSGDFTVHLWERARGQEVARMNHDDEVFSVAFSPDSKYLVSGSEDHTARVWEIETGQEIARMTHDDEVFSVAFSPDGKYILSGSLDKTARLWEAITGKEFTRLQHEDSVEGIAFSPDGKYVATSSRDSTVRIWDLATEELIASMAHEPDSNVRAVAFSQDGNYVVSGSSDYTIRVWETTTGREVTRMIHDSNVRAVVFSPDGNYILSGSSDNTVRVWEWEARTAREVTRMIHDDRLNSVAFSSDGNYVLSGSEDTLARIWLWRPEDLIEKACARVTRTLTSDEWNQYLQGEPYQPVCQNLPMESGPILTPAP